MISVVDRLVESWLDSQGERQYQPAFIQLLVSEGWSVLHNTRHSPIELGKDVVARSPSGELHCFQLKGNPASRVTKTEAQGLLPQVIELIDLPPSNLYRKDGEPHVAVFVTNGTVDEEAELVFGRAGDRTAAPACPASRFEIITRGDLLARFVKVAGLVWPTSIEGTRSVLNLMAEDGRGLPDPLRIGEVLLATAPPPDEDLSQPARSARLNALLLIAEIIKAPWRARSNHFAMFVITLLAVVHALRFCDTRRRLDVARLYAGVALEHARDLLAEAQAAGFAADQVWAEGFTLDEVDVMHERGRLVALCAAILSLNRDEETPTELADYRDTLVAKSVEQPMLWGFGAVPAYLVRWWAYERRGGVTPSRQLAAILVSLLTASKGADGLRPLPGPYYDFTDVWAWRNEVPNVADSAIFADNFEGRVWFGRALLQMLASRDEKDLCQSIWPIYADQVHEEPQLPADRFFAPGLVRGVGRLSSQIFEAKTWDALRADSQAFAGADFLEAFPDLAWVIAAYIAIIPYRAWTDVVMWLDHTLKPATAATMDRQAAP
jgi:hypothetical protein